MLVAVICAVITVALFWVLTFIGGDTLYITAVQELFGKEATSASYYFLAFMLGLLFVIIRMFQKR